MRTGRSTRGRVTVGYRLLGSDGTIFSFGEAEEVGSLGADRAWVALAPWAEQPGLVAVARDGSVGQTGTDAPADDTGVAPGGAPAVDVTTTATGEGFWILDAAGGVFSFGDAGFYGSIPGLGEGVTTAPIVAMASTATGAGYWILDGAGGIFAFGDAEFFGSTPALRLDASPAPAIDLVATTTGDGYAILESDGSIRAFGDARPQSLDTGAPVQPVAFAATSQGGFVVVDARGFVHPTGPAPMFGSTANLRLRAPIVDVVAVSVTDPSAL